VDALASSQGDPLRTVTRASALIATLAIAQAAIRTASRILLFNAGRNVEYRLRATVFSRLMHKPLAFFGRHPVGDLMSRLTSDLTAVRMLFGPAVLNVLNTAIVYATGLALLVHLSPRLTAFAILPFPLVIAFGRLSSRTIYRASRALSEQTGVLSTALQEDLAGIAAIRAYGLEARQHARFAAHSDELFRRSAALVQRRGLLSPVFALVGALGTLIVLWMGGREVIAGRLTVGELVAFNAYLVYLSWPTLALGWVLSLWQRGVAGWRRVQEVVDEAEAGAPPDPVAGGLRPRDASIRVEGLTVERGGRRLLDGVSFSVAPGRTLAVVGRTGSGKSTLTDALLRFVEVPRGAIFVGGHDVHDLTTESLRGHVGYAPQEAFLFSATIAENIAFGRRDDDAPPDERRAALLRAARAAGLDRDLAAFPEGEETLVGERGITLSGGQRQRVALARALYADPPILILDDSLSAVDAETERFILRNIRPLLEGRTTLLVSHRVAAVEQADEILVLDRGRVAERGAHEALVAAGGVYAQLYREQRALGEAESEGELRPPGEGRP
jgi:ATP-binding cassette subfamily B protein